MRGKAVVKTGNLKTPLDSAKQEASWDKDRAHQMADAVTPELCTAKSTLEDVSGRPQEVFKHLLLLSLSLPYQDSLS